MLLLVVDITHLVLRRWPCSRRANSPDRPASPARAQFDLARAQCDRHGGDPCSTAGRVRHWAAYWAKNGGPSLFPTRRRPPFGLARDVSSSLWSLIADARLATTVDDPPHCSAES